MCLQRNSPSAKVHQHCCLDPMTWDDNEDLKFVGGKCEKPATSCSTSRSQTIVIYFLRSTSDGCSSAWEQQPRAFSPYCIMSSVTPNAEESTSSAGAQIVKPKSARTYREVQPPEPPQPLPRRPQTSEGKPKIIITCCAIYSKRHHLVCLCFLAQTLQTLWCIWFRSRRHARVSFLTFI